MFKRNPFTGFLPRTSGLDSARLQTSALLLLLAITCTSKTAHAQAIAAADRGGQIDAFGAYTYTKPDYGLQSSNGFSVGGDFLLRKFIFGRPGIAARYARVTGKSTNESFGGGGLELHYRFGPIRPYATVLLGLGTISSPPVHYSDSGREVLFGGGVDVPLRHRFSARGEFTYGFLHIAGKNGGSQGEINLTPASATVGLVYNIK